MPLLIYNFVHLPTSQNTNIHLTKSLFFKNKIMLQLFICVLDHIRSGLPTKHAQKTYKSQQLKYVDKTRNMPQRDSSLRFNL